MEDIDETQNEHLQEVKTALDMVLTIEDRADQIEPDDIKELCGKIKLPLMRIVRDIEDGKIKGENL